MTWFQTVISRLHGTRIGGRPAHAAEWVREGVYLLRWLAIVATFAWLNNYYIFLVVERGSFAWGHPWLVAGATTAAVTAAGAFAFLMPRALTVSHARHVVFLVLLTLTLAAAVIVGLTRLNPTFTPILNLTLLGGLAAAPLRLTPQITLAAVGVLGALVLAISTGWPLHASEVLRLSPTVTYRPDRHRSEPVAARDVPRASPVGVAACASEAEVRAPAGADAERAGGSPP